MINYKIVDSDNNEISTIDESLLDFITEVEYMIALYKKSQYTKSEEVRNKLKEKLIDLC